MSLAANATTPNSSRQREAIRNLRLAFRRSGTLEMAAGLAILFALGGIALLAPIIAPHDPNAIDYHRVIAGPDSTHPFGSDALGRDVLSRILFALRVSLVVAIGSVALAAVFGLPTGLVAGFAGGWIDNALMRPIDILLAFPALLLAIAFIAIVGPGSTVALIAIGIIYLPILTRVIRSSVLVTRQQDFVLGARARGSPALRTLALHVLPNSVGPTLAQASILTAFAIQIQAALSFIGLGAQPPTAELGVMLYEGRDVFTIAPWVEIYPGLVLAAAVLGFILLGNGLSARFQPRRR